MHFEKHKITFRQRALQKPMIFGIVAF